MDLLKCTFRCTVFFFVFFKSSQWNNSAFIETWAYYKTEVRTGRLVGFPVSVCGWPCGGEPFESPSHSAVRLRWQKSPADSPDHECATGPQLEFRSELGSPALASHMAAHKTTDPNLQMSGVAYEFSFFTLDTFYIYVHTLQGVLPCVRTVNPVSVYECITVLDLNWGKVNSPERQGFTNHWTILLYSLLHASLFILCVLSWSTAVANNARARL